MSLRPVLDYSGYSPEHSATGCHGHLTACFLHHLLILSKASCECEYHCPSSRIQRASRLPRLDGPLMMHEQNQNLQSQLQKNQKQPRASYIGPKQVQGAIYQTGHQTYHLTFWKILGKPFSLFTNHFKIFFLRYIFILRSQITISPRASRFRRLRNWLWVGGLQEVRDEEQTWGDVREHRGHMEKGGPSEGQVKGFQRQPGYSH